VITEQPEIADETAIADDHAEEDAKREARSQFEAIPKQSLQHESPDPAHSIEIDRHLLRSHASVDQRSTKNPSFVLSLNLTLYLGRFGNVSLLPAFVLTTRTHARRRFDIGDSPNGEACERRWPHRQGQPFRERLQDVRRLSERNRTRRSILSVRAVTFR
jgi:hypothetical protein